MFCHNSEPNKSDLDNEELDFCEWRLYRYLGEKESKIIPKIRKTTQDLGNGITQSLVLELFNLTNQNFDFDYQPEERDCLSISVANISEEIKYFQIIYRNGYWKSGSNPRFTSVMETMGKGWIKSRDLNSDKTEWIHVKKNSLDQIYSRLFRKQTPEKYWENIDELVKRNSNFCFTKAKALIQSTVEVDNLIGSNILVFLYNSGKYEEAIWPMFFDILKTEPNEEIICSILEALNYKNENLSPKHIEFLKTFVNRSDKMNISLMEAFQTLESDEVIEVFIDFSRDGNDDVREEAVYNLGIDIDKDNLLIRKALWERVSDSVSSIKYNSILGLCLRKDEKIRPILIKEMENDIMKNSTLKEALEALDKVDL